MLTQEYRNRRMALGPSELRQFTPLILGGILGAVIALAARRSGVDPRRFLKNPSFSPRPSLRGPGHSGEPLAGWGHGA